MDWLRYLAQKRKEAAERIKTVPQVEWQTKKKDMRIPNLGSNVNSKNSHHHGIPNTSNTFNASHIANTGNTGNPTDDISLKRKAEHSNDVELNFANQSLKKSAREWQKVDLTALESGKGQYVKIGKLLEETKSVSHGQHYTSESAAGESSAIVAEKIKKGIDAKVRLKVDEHHKQGLSARDIIEALKNDEKIDQKDLPLDKQVVDRCCYLDKSQKQDLTKQDHNKDKGNAIVAEKTKKGIDAKVRLKVDEHYKQGLSARDIIEALKNDKEIDQKDLPLDKQVVDRCCYLGRSQEQDLTNQDLKNKAVPETHVPSRDTLQTIERCNLLPKVNSTQTCQIKRIAHGMKLDEFIGIKKLGYGQFGSVFLVQHKELDAYFALKAVLRAKVYEYDQQKYILQEKAVLETVEFPFIMKFVRTFKDTDHLYFLTEYIEGYELFEVLQDKGPLQTCDARFYIASIILALEYLHSKNIIYRDLKPENIMVDKTGYIKLVDMGMARFLEPKRERINSISGTTRFMAPEVLAGENYDFTADLWSLGICLYEFICGRLPFGQNTNNPSFIYKEIQTMPVSFPYHLQDIGAKKLITQLLSINPKERLGGSFADLKKDPWFNNFDWDKLLAKELQPPSLTPETGIASQNPIQTTELASIKAVTMIEDDEEKAYPKVFRKNQEFNQDWDKDF